MNAKMARIVSGGLLKNVVMQCCSLEKLVPVAELVEALSNGVVE